MNQRRLSLFQLIAYSLPIFGIEFIIVPILIVLPSYYVANGTGSFAAFGTAVLVSRIVYSCGGPLIGYLSDRWNTPWGRRRPWMLAGLVIAVVAALMLFLPPKGASPWYFGFASSLALFAFSVIDVPYIAWGTEISRDAATRTRITTYRAALATASTFVFLGLPLVVPGFGGHNVLQTSVINRLGYVAAATIVVTVLIALLFGPRTAETSEEAPPAGELLRVLRGMLTNAPMWWFTGAIVFTFLTNLQPATVAIPFMNSLRLTDWFQGMTMLGIAAGIVLMPLWLAITYRIGKTRSWAFLLAVTACGSLVYFPLAALFGPFVALLTSTIVAAAPAAYMTASLPYSVMADIIDYDEERTGRNHAANYSAITLLIIRFQTAIAGALGFYVLSFFGYRFNGSNTPLANFGLYFDEFALPVIFALAGIACLRLFPLNDPHHVSLKERNAHAV